jgi:hypothetical protein
VFHQENTNLQQGEKEACSCAARGATLALQLRHWKRRFSVDLPGKQCIGDEPIIPVSTARQFDNAGGRVTYLTAVLLC